MGGPDLRVDPVINATLSAARVVMADAKMRSAASSLDLRL